MKKLTLMAMALLAVGLTAAPSLAGTNMHGMYSESNQTNLINNSELIGFNVLSQKNEVVGSIVALNKDKKSGNINYLIVATKGTMGQAERHAIPLEDLSLNKAQRTATLLVSVDKLKSAPAEKAGMTADDFKGYIQEHYGVSPAWEEQNGMRPQGKTPARGY